jgi:hypothetical protein
MRRWAHVVVLLAMAALLANSECYIHCLTPACQSSSMQQAGDCHHSTHSEKRGSSSCDHKFLDAANTRTSPNLPVLAAVQFNPVSNAAVLASPCGACTQTRNLHRVWWAWGSPPANSLLASFSVLRI